jgi:hypothetical protein
MTSTKKYKKSKSAKRRTHSRMSSSKRRAELYAKNNKRNSIIRNIRMGRSTFSRLGGGSYIRRDGGYTNQQQGGGSQFVGSPWTVSNNPNTGNYFAPSLLGVGTGLVPKFDDGQPLSRGGERWPTQLGPQLAKLGEMKGGGGGGRSRRNGRRTKTSRGGGVFDDIKGVYNNAISSATEFNSRLQGVKPPPSSYSWDQPIARSNI